MDDAEDIRAFEYAVLVTSLEDEILSIVTHYRDRADCENNFDEIKNRCGWAGFTTQNINPCRFVARIIALIYNWWNIFALLANPAIFYSLKAITPQLSSAVHWWRILSEAMKKYLGESLLKPPNENYLTAKAERMEYFSGMIGGENTANGIHLTEDLGSREKPMDTNTQPDPILQSDYWQQQISA